MDAHTESIRVLFTESQLFREINALDNTFYLLNVALMIRCFTYSYLHFYQYILLYFEQNPSYRTIYKFKSLVVEAA